MRKKMKTRFARSCLCSFNVTFHNALKDLYSDQLLHVDEGDRQNWEQVLFAHFMQNYFLHNLFLCNSFLKYFLCNIIKKCAQQDDH